MSDTRIKWIEYIDINSTGIIISHLTHWGRVTHISVSKLNIPGSDNSLSPGWRQAIIWTSAGILLIRTVGTHFSKIFSEIHTISFKKMPLKWSPEIQRPFYLGLNVLISFPLYLTTGINWARSKRFRVLPALDYIWLQSNITMLPRHWWLGHIKVDSDVAWPL